MEEEVGSKLITGNLSAPGTKEVTTDEGLIRIGKKGVRFGTKSFNYYRVVCKGIVPY